MSEHTNEASPEVAPSTEHREIYKPSAEVVARARIKDREHLQLIAHHDPEDFWAAEAAQLGWFRKWDSVLDDSNKPFFKWFSGAKFNIVHNALDRPHADISPQQNCLHLAGRGRQRAIRVVSRVESDGQQIRQRAEVEGGAKGRPRDHLHGARAGIAGGNARLRRKSARFTRWFTAGSRLKRCEVAFRIRIARCSSHATGRT